MPESECSLVKEIALYSCSRNQTMVFCCIAAWIQPDQTDCLQDFLLSEIETCWEHFEDFSRIILNDFRNVSETISFLGDKKSSWDQLSGVTRPLYNRMLCCIFGLFSQKFVAMWAFFGKKIVKMTSKNMVTLKLSWVVAGKTGGCPRHHPRRLLCPDDFPS